MSIIIEAKKPKIEIQHEGFERLYDTVIKDGHICATGYIGHQCEDHSLGLSVSHTDTRRHGWERGIVEILMRAGAAGWQVCPILKPGSFAAYPKGVVINPEFGGVCGIGVDGGAFLITVKNDRHSDGVTFILRDSDILGFKLITPTVTLNKRRIECGHIKLLRHYEQYHEYWVDIKVPDSRMLSGLADLSEFRGVKELIRPGVKALADGGWVVENVVDLAVGLKLLDCDYPRSVSYEGVRKRASLDPNTEEGMLIIKGNNWGIEVQGLDNHIQALIDIRDWNNEAKEKTKNAE